MSGTKYIVKQDLIDRVEQNIKENNNNSTTSQKIQTELLNIIESLWGSAGVETSEASAVGYSIKRVINGNKFIAQVNVGFPVDWAGPSGETIVPILPSGLVKYFKFQELVTISTNSTVIGSQSYLPSVTFNELIKRGTQERIALYGAGAGAEGRHTIATDYPHTSVDGSGYLGDYQGGNLLPKFDTFAMTMKLNFQNFHKGQNFTILIEGLITKP